MKKIIVQSAVALFIIVVSFVGGIYVKTILTPPVEQTTPEQIFDSVATVNLEQIISVSPKWTEIRKENDKELDELSKWVDEVKKEIDAEIDLEKRNKLAQQYIKLTKDKEAFIRHEYNRKIQVIDEEITALIKKVAEQNGYKIVFPKTSVVFGGKDITEEVLKAIKK